MSQVTRVRTAGGHEAKLGELPGFPTSYHRKLANPSPIGLLGFGVTTLVLSLFNLHTRGVESTQAVVTLAVMTGGASQWLAGIYEAFAGGSTFGLTAFCGYGVFWFGYAIINIGFFGLTGEYNGVPGVYMSEAGSVELPQAIGLWLSTWFVFTIIMTIAATRSSVGLLALFIVLDLVFALLMAGAFTGSESVNKAAGALGVIDAFIALYCAAAGLLTKETSYFVLPLGPLGERN